MLHSFLAGVRREICGEPGVLTGFWGRVRMVLVWWYESWLFGVIGDGVKDELWIDAQDGVVIGDGRSMVSLQ